MDHFDVSCARWADDKQVGSWGVQSAWTEMFNRRQWNGCQQGS